MKIFKVVRCSLRGSFRNFILIFFLSLFFSPPSPPTSQKSNHVTPLTVLKKLERKTCRTALHQDHGDFIIPNNRPMISIIKLDKMLDAIDTGEFLKMYLRKNVNKILEFFVNSDVDLSTTQTS